MSRTWYHLAQHFDQHGNDINLLARAFPGQPPVSQEAGVTITRIGGFDSTPSLPLNLVKDFFYALNLARKLPEADATILNDFWLPALTPYLNSKAGKTVVSVNRMPKGQYKLYRNCDCFVCPNSQVADRLKDQCPELAAKIEVIPNPYDSSSFYPADKLRQGLLYVGRLHPEKGLHLLLKAFRLLHADFSHIKLNIVGSWESSQGGGGDRYHRELLALADGLPVEWLGPIYDTDQLHSLYQSHLIFIYPSLAEQGETFGIAPVEAMACGCIPVVSQLSVFTNFLRHAENGFQFPHHTTNPDSELHQILHHILNNPDQQITWSQAATRSVAPFSTQSVGDQFLALLQHLTS